MSHRHVKTGDPDHQIWTVQERLDYYGETNAHGGAICPPEYFHLPHRVDPLSLMPLVVATCTCGWTPHNGYILADHLRDFGATSAL